MCGIAGKYSSTSAVDVSVVVRMTDALQHRGPDDSGAWSDGMAALGSRRLAIIDLSPRGRMPMQNEDGSLHLVFNGEIYNFKTLRRDLEKDGHTFHSDSDSEVVLHLYEKYGTDAVTHLRGMFAFALWDAPRRRLWLVRDRLGKKPLFYAFKPGSLSFASELGALLQDSDIAANPDLEALHHYMSWGYVPAPLSAVENVRKLPPAHHLVLEDGRISIHRYWAVRYEPKQRASEHKLREELLARLEDAVRSRLISDVPLGALLSGGIDSSVIVALMRRATSGPIRTFSIGFEQPEYDEARYARLVADAFGAEHHEFVMRPDGLEWLERLGSAYSEPFADSSAIPSLALCQMARRYVTVALNGDGGDESFAGYDRYRAMKLSDAAVARVPHVLRALALHSAARLKVTQTKSVLARVRRFATGLTLEPGDRYAQWLTCAPDDLKASLYGPAMKPYLAINTRDAIGEPFRMHDPADVAEQAMRSDIEFYLPNDLLVKMDIASMANSLEVRSPFLDQHVVEFAASLPLELKLRGGTQKYLLKSAFAGILPDEVVNRKKMGFGVPVDHWLRGELKTATYEILLDDKAVSRGYFQKKAVTRLLDEHVHARTNHQFVLWAMLVLELWHTHFIDSARDPHGASTVLQAL